MGNGFVPANPLSGAPRSRPGQRGFPSPCGPLPLPCPLLLLGPFQILTTAAASAGVRQVLSVDVHDERVIVASVLGSYAQVRGSSISPSMRPSFASQAKIAALVTKISLAADIGAPRSTFITTCGQISAAMKRSQ